MPCWSSIVTTFTNYEALEDALKGMGGTILATGDVCVCVRWPDGTITSFDRRSSRDTFEAAGDLSRLQELKPEYATSGVKLWGKKNRWQISTKGRQVILTKYM